MEIENEVNINSQVTAQILFNHALVDFAPVYHSIIRLLYEAFSIWSLFKQQDIFWEIETDLLFIVVITLVCSKSHKKTCKERNQLLVHTLKNCNKSFVDKKSIICHQTKTHTPTKQRHCTGYADNLVRFHGVTQGRKLISLPLERIL